MLERILAALQMQAALLPAENKRQYTTSKSVIQPHTRIQPSCILYHETFWVLCMHVYVAVCVCVCVVR